MLQKGIDWLLGILSVITAALVLDAIKFRRNISEKYVLKDDFLRIMAENRQDHQIIFNKLDDVLKELSKKEDRR